jgi:hypothetical protein
MKKNVMKRRCSPRKVIVRLYTNVHDNKLCVRAAIAGEPHTAIGGKLLLEIVPGDTGNIEGQWRGLQKAILQRTIRKLLPGTAEQATFPVSKLPTGSWSVRPTFIDRHGQACETDVVQDRLGSKMPQWFGSSKGVNRKVVPPWTPIEMQQTRSMLSVNCWGREHRFKANSILSQVTSQGTALLSGPVRVIATANGRKIRWQKSKLDCLSHAADQAVFIGSQSAKNLSLNIQTETDFDGMMRFDVALIPSAPVKLESLILEIPIRKEYAKYFFQYRGRAGSDTKIGRIPAKGLVKGFRPFVWIGDEERGLSWFAESNDDWLNADPDSCITVKREGDSVVLRMNLVSTPVELVPSDGSAFPYSDSRPLQKKQLRYTFGLQATPVKHEEKDAWDHRIFCLQQTNAAGVNGRLELPPKLLDRLDATGVRTVVIFEHWTDIEGHVIPKNKAKLKKIIRDLHERGIQVLLYFGFLLSEIAPEYDDLGQSSLALPKTGWSLMQYPPQPPQTAWRVCLRSTWQDFLAESVAYVMDELDADGVYLDGTADPYSCRNMLHGCGNLRHDASVGPTFPIFSVRSAMRRIYDAVKSRKPEGQVNVHNSACMVMPTLSWATSTWDGEQFAGLEWGSRYKNVLDLEAFKTEFMGHQWGVPAELLSYEKPLDFHEAWALAIVHDVPVRAMLKGQKNDVEYNRDIWAVMDEFGRKQADWIPYWRNGNYVNVSPKEVCVSLYRHSKNGVLAVISNLSNKPATVKLACNLRSLNMKGCNDATLLKWTLGKEKPLARTPVSLREGRIELKMKSTDWLMLWIPRR